MAISAGLGSGLVSSMANAQFAYNYLQAAYVFGDFELANGDVGFNGFEITAQFELSPSFAVGVNYLSIDGDETVTSVTGENILEYEGDGLEAFVLYHTPVSAQADFLLGARIDMREFEARVQGDVPVFETDDDTNFLFTGLRYQLNGLELQGEWSYLLDADNGEDRWSYTLGVLSGNAGQFQLGFSLTPDNTGDVMRVFIRQAY